MADFFNINPDVPPEIKLEERFKQERAEWTKKTKDLAATLKHVADLPILMVDLYSERQRAVEYHHYLMDIFILVSRKYRAQYNERYEFYSFKSQIRFPNESTKNARIIYEMADIVEKRELIDNHQKFMSNTIASLDAIIYAINNRVKYEEIVRGK